MTIHPIERNPPLSNDDFLHDRLKEEEATKALVDYLNVHLPVESEKSRKKRESILSDLNRLLKEWIIEVALSQELFSTPEEAAEVGGVLMVAGSYRIGVNSDFDDTDVVCFCPGFVTKNDFFTSFVEKLYTIPALEFMNPLSDARVSIIEAVIDGIPLDLSFCRVHLDSVPDIGTGEINPTSGEGVFNVLDDFVLNRMTSSEAIAVNGPRVTEMFYLLNPDFEKFKIIVRSLRLWAKRRGLYSNKAGYLGGVNISLLSTFICQLYPRLSAAATLFCFFEVLSQWNWPDPISINRPYLLDDHPLNEDVWMATNPRFKNDIMPVITSAFPFGNSLYSVIPASLDTMCREFLLAFNVCYQIIYGNPSESSSGKENSVLDRKYHWENLFKYSDFFHEFDKYLEVELTASDNDQLEKWAGFFGAKFRLLAQQISVTRHVRIARIWPDGEKSKKMVKAMYVDEDEVTLGDVIEEEEQEKENQQDLTLTTTQARKRAREESENGNDNEGKQHRQEGGNEPETKVEPDTAESNQNGRAEESIVPEVQAATLAAMNAHNGVNEPEYIPEKEGRHLGPHPFLIELSKSNSDVPVAASVETIQTEDSNVKVAIPELLRCILTLDARGVLDALLKGADPNVRYTLDELETAILLLQKDPFSSISNGAGDPVVVSSYSGPTSQLTLKDLALDLAGFFEFSTVMRDRSSVVIPDTPVTTTTTTTSALSSANVSSTAGTGTIHASNRPPLPVKSSGVNPPLPPPLPPFSQAPPLPPVPYPSTAVPSESDLETIKTEKIAELRAKNAGMETPLFLCARLGDRATEIASLLLRFGASVTTRNVSSVSSLGVCLINLFQSSSSRGFQGFNEKLSENIVESERDDHIKTDRGRLLSLLLINEADPNHNLDREKDGWKPLALARRTRATVENLLNIQKGVAVKNMTDREISIFLQIMFVNQGNEKIDLSSIVSILKQRISVCCLAETLLLANYAIDTRVSKGLDTDEIEESKNDEEVMKDLAEKSKNLSVDEKVLALLAEVDSYFEKDVASVVLPLDTTATPVKKKPIDVGTPTSTSVTSATNKRVVAVTSDALVAFELALMQMNAVYLSAVFHIAEKSKGSGNASEIYFPVFPDIINPPEPVSTSSEVLSVLHSRRMFVNYADPSRTEDSIEEEMLVDVKHLLYPHFLHILLNPRFAWLNNEIINFFQPLPPETSPDSAEGEQKEGDIEKVSGENSAPSQSADAIIVTEVVDEVAAEPEVVKVTLFSDVELTALVASLSSHPSILSGNLIDREAFYCDSIGFYDRVALSFCPAVTEFLDSSLVSRLSFEMTDSERTSFFLLSSISDDIAFINSASALCLDPALRPDTLLAALPPDVASLSPLHLAASLGREVSVQSLVDIASAYFAGIVAAAVADLLAKGDTSVESPTLSNEDIVDMYVSLNEDNSTFGDFSPTFFKSVISSIADTVQKKYDLFIATSLDEAVGRSVSNVEGSGVILNSGEGISDAKATKNATFDVASLFDEHFADFPRILRVGSLKSLMSHTNVSATDAMEVVDASNEPVHVHSGEESPEAAVDASILVEIHRLFYRTILEARIHGLLNRMLLTEIPSNGMTVLHCASFRLRYKCVQTIRNLINNNPLFRLHKSLDSLVDYVIASPDGVYVPPPAVPPSVLHYKNNNVRSRISGLFPTALAKSAPRYYAPFSTPQGVLRARRPDDTEPGTTELPVSWLDVPFSRLLSSPSTSRKNEDQLLASLGLRRASTLASIAVNAPNASLTSETDPRKLTLDSLLRFEELRDSRLFYIGVDVDPLVAGNVKASRELNTAIRDAVAGFRSDQISIWRGKSDLMLMTVRFSDWKNIPFPLKVKVVRQQLALANGDELGPPDASAVDEEEVLQYRRSLRRKLAEELKVAEEKKSKDLSWTGDSSAAKTEITDKQVNELAPTNSTSSNVAVTISLASPPTSHTTRQLLSTSAAKRNLSFVNEEALTSMQKRNAEAALKNTSSATTSSTGMVIPGLGSVSVPTVTSKASSIAPVAPSILPVSTSTVVSNPVESSSVVTSMVSTPDSNASVVPKSVAPISDTAVTKKAPVKAVKKPRVMLKKD